VDYTFKAYEGATHAFTSPEADAHAKKFELPIAYHPEADKQSWADMQQFFDKIFNK
jgi:dienelactone hydrolase